MPLRQPPPITKDSDPTYANDSALPVSSSWVRRALSAIATTAGFSIQTNAASGGINFPSWLGGWQVRWGTMAAQGAVNFWQPFTTQCAGVVPQSTAGTGVYVRVHAVSGSITVNGFTYDTENVNNSAGNYIAWGN